MRYDQWNTNEPAPKATGTDRGSVRFLIFAVLTVVVVGCVYSPRLGLVTGTGTFFVAGTLLWLASGIVTFFWDSWFGSSTNGTSGKLGLAVAWIVVRLIAGVVLAALGASLTVSYGAALLIGVALFFVFDMIFIIVGN